MERITSGQNPKIRRLAALQQKARIRREEGSFVIEGLRLFRDTPPRFLKAVYLTEESLPQLQSAFSERLEEVPVYVLPQSLLEKVSDTRTPQGILCEVQMPEYSRQELKGGAFLPEEQQAPLILALEDIQDPGNLGTMFRTAEAAGATGILLSEGCADVFSPKTVRATMSAVFRVPFVTCEDFPEAVRSLRRDGMKTVAACLDRNAVCYTEAELTGESGGTALLIGNEGNGLSAEAIDAAEQGVFIPMQGQIESLNAAVAASILLYEVRRQRVLQKKRR